MSNYSVSYIFHPDKPAEIVVAGSADFLRKYFFEPSGVTRAEQIPDETLRGLCKIVARAIMECVADRSLAYSISDGDGMRLEVEPDELDSDVRVALMPDVDLSRLDPDISEVTFSLREEPPDNADATKYLGGYTLSKTFSPPNLAG